MISIRKVWRILFNLCLAFTTIFLLPIKFNVMVEASTVTSQELLNFLRIKIHQNKATRVDLIQALSEDKVILLPYSSNIGRDSVKLPEPPDSALSRQIYEMLKGFPYAVPSLTLLIFPSIKLGGLYTVEGSGDCLDWVLFDYNSKLSHQIPTPRIFQPGLCTRDGSESTLAFVENRLVALNYQVIPLEEEVPLQPTRIGMRLTLQSWNGENWDKPATLKLGYK